MIRILFEWLVFPGAALIFLGGLAADFAERKWTARMQRRTGPEPFQPLYDLIKLAVKQDAGSRPAAPGRWRTAAPAVGFACAAGFSLLVWRSAFLPGRGFRGDLFAAIGLLTAASCLRPIGVFTASAGKAAWKRIRFSMTAAVPLALSASVPCLEAGEGFRIGSLAAFQGTYGMLAATPAGSLAFAVAFFSAFALFRFAPFESPDNGVETAGGSDSDNQARCRPRLWIELGRMAVLFSLPGFLVTLFLGGDGAGAAGIAFTLAKVAGCLLLLTFVRNIGGRLTPRQGIRILMGPLTFLALVSAAMSLLKW
jgi:NADH-quinone oxidoreductase subunit H